MSVKEYLHRKYILLNTPAIINKNGHFRLFEGQLIKEKQFRKYYELPISLKKDNANKFKKYLIN